MADPFRHAHPQFFTRGPTIVHFVDENSQDRYFTVSPTFDLLYFQLESFHASWWRQLYNFGSDKLQVGLLGNIALELDPA
jgi:hypothetical protein